MVQRGAGRPGVGPAINVRFPDELLDRIDVAARGAGVSRASWLRGAAEDQLAYPRSALAALVTWMVDQAMVDDISYVIERIDKHTDLLYCALHGIPGDLYDELIGLREHALQHDDVLPEGWTVSATTPVDFAVTCSHGLVVDDTEATRAAAYAPACPEGCRDRYRDEFRAALTGCRPIASSRVAQVHQLRPGRRRIPS